MNRKNLHFHKLNKPIVEIELGIPPDYQYKAIRSRNFVQSNWHHNKMFVINKLANFNKHMDVLDLGTGSGNFELNFASKVRSLVGVDYNDEAINFLRKKVAVKKIKNVETIVSDIRNLTLSKRKFDLVVLIDVIEHFNFNDVENIFRHFNNYLKPHGRVIIITPNYKSLWPIIEYLFDLLELAPKFREHQHLSKLYSSNLQKLIEENGFEVRKLCTFNFFSFLIPSRKISRAICLLETKIPFLIGNLIAIDFSKKET